MKSRSIQKRLMLAVLVSQALLATGLTCAGVLYTRQRVQTSIDEGVRARALSIAALVRFPEDGSKGLLFDQSLAPRSVDGVHPDIFQVSTESLGVIGASGIWPQRFPDNCRVQNVSFDLTWSSVPYRVLCLTDVPMLDREENQPTYSLRVFYAAPSWQIESEERKAGFYIALSSLVLMTGTTLLAMWGIRRTLLPLQHLADQSSQISALNWQFQVPPEAELTDELQPLTLAIQRMLERLQKSFSEQREFLGNAAHELKTPVAILKSTLQRIVQKPRTSQEYELGIRRALDDMERLEKLLHWMLRLARAEQWAYGTLRRELSTVDLRSTCEAAVERLRSLADQNCNEIQFSSHGDVIIRADPEDLQTIWVNLLENAIRFSPPGAPIRINVAANGNDCAKVIVEDRGRGIPSEDLDRVFERFHRADASRARETGGFGLGLAIAKALTEAYGGSIRAESQLGCGTRFVVELPVSRG